MVGGQGLLTNVQSLLVHVFSHLVFPPLRVQRGQVVEGLSAVRMIGTKHTLAHLQGATQEYLGGAGEDKSAALRFVAGASAGVGAPSALLQVVLKVVEDAQLIQSLGSVGGVFSQGQLFQLQRSASQQAEAVLTGGDAYSH